MKVKPEQLWRTRRGQLNLEVCRYVERVKGQLVTYKDLDLFTGAYSPAKTIRIKSFLAWARQNKAKP